jgi:predicted SAM-dependent methyltransferase
MKLDIGAGRFKRDETYRSVDIAEGADIVAPMWEIPVEDNSVEDLYSSHALEHVEMTKVPATLKEWLRIMKPGARGEVIVPNFDYIARYWLTGPDRVWAEQMVFGNQTEPGQGHKCAFTAAVLRGDLEGVGFEVKRVEVIWSHNQESLKAVFRKPERRPEGETLQ